MLVRVTDPINDRKSSLFARRVARSCTYNRSHQVIAAPRESLPVLRSSKLHPFMATRHAPLIVGLALIAACAQVPPPPAPVPAPAPPPVAAPEPPPPPPPPPPVTPATIREAQVLAEKTIVPLLEQGNEEQARVELDRALQKDPNNKLVANLLRQLNDDPTMLLGRESFGYTIRPNDTLSTIAAAYLKDKYLFYALARYNGIAVPKQVVAGQQIKVPGKAGAAVPKAPPAKGDGTPPPAAPEAPPVATPPAAPAPAPAPSPPPPPPAPVVLSPGEQALQAGAAAEKSGNLERALAEYQRAAVAGQPDAADKVASVRAKLKAAYTRDARTARANQRLEAAIAAWDQVLTLDPSDEAAKRERAQAVELKAKLDQQRRVDPSK